MSGYYGYHHYIDVWLLWLPSLYWCLVTMVTIIMLMSGYYGYHHYIDVWLLWLPSLYWCLVTMVTIIMLMSVTMLTVIMWDTAPIYMLMLLKMAESLKHVCHSCILLYHHCTYHWTTPHVIPHTIRYIQLVLGGIVIYYLKCEICIHVSSMLERICFYMILSIQSGDILRSLWNALI